MLPTPMVRVLQTGDGLLQRLFLGEELCLPRSVIITVNILIQIGIQKTLELHRYVPDRHLLVCNKRAVGMGSFSFLVIEL